MIAEVAFDAPVDHPFSYLIPAGLTVSPGQRVLAPLRGARRVGMVVRLREGDPDGLRPLLGPADRAPVLSADGLALVEWISRESLSSVGSTCAALLPPPGADVPVRDAIRTSAGGGPSLDVLVGAGRERRLLDRVAQAARALIIVPDLDSAARWARRLGLPGGVVRLDSGVEDAARAQAWQRLAEGTARVAVGTRSALLAPLPPPALLALIDEHEATHRPPGPPRIHAREVVLERGRREGLALVLTSATPSVETWWHATERGTASPIMPAPGPWPAVSISDTRGILRREPLTPPLARAVRETLSAGRRVLLLVSRRASSLACDECGEVVRCSACALALSYSRSGGTLRCRLCGTTALLPETCGHCRGRRLSPFGWGLERVEHAVRRRFPQARVARWDPEAPRGSRGEAQRAAAAGAEIVIGTRGALRLFGPASLGLAGFVSPDQLLRLPDFRAGERMLAQLWAAAERVGAHGALVIQSQNPTHYALEAVARQDLAVFYGPELTFRAELGYPPFRRLAVLTISGANGQRLAEAVVAALRGVPGLTVYPPVAERRDRTRRLVVKGDSDLPQVLAAALQEFRGPRSKHRGIMDAEVDPVEWLS
jgi:primosomal protein N'